MALREIADETIQLDQLQNALIKGMQKHVEIDEPEEEDEIEIGDVSNWPVDLATGRAEKTIPASASTKRCRKTCSKSPRTKSPASMKSALPEIGRGNPATPSSAKARRRT